MKKIIALITVAFISINIQAQTTDKAKKLLDEVAAKTTGYKNMVLDFTYNSGKQNTIRKVDTIQRQNC